MKKFGILFIVLVGIATTSFGQTSANADANASATIVGSLTLAKTDDLKFGQMTSPSAPSTVTVTPAGGISSTGTIALIGGSPVSAAAYNVSGTQGATYAITLPADNAVKLTGAGADMPLTAFSCSYATKVSTLGAPVAGINDTFSVGATLNVGTGQAQGVYGATFNVAIAYN
jgi:hypothetical protein